MLNYLIDGYNLLFFLEEYKGSLQEQREDLLSFLAKRAASSPGKWWVVFDANQKCALWDRKSHKNSLHISYTAHNETADELILHILERKNSRKSWVVVSNDNALTRHARSLGAKSLSCGEFLKRFDDISYEDSEKPRPSNAELKRYLPLFSPEAQKKEKPTPLKDPELKRLWNIFHKRLDQGESGDS